METRRIIKNRKTILACCIILLFNGLWYYYQQQSYWKNYNYSISAASKIQKDYLMELDGMAIEAQLQLIANKKEKIEKSLSTSTNDVNHLLGKSFMLEEIEKSVRYIAAYPKILSQIKNRAQLMSSINIFQQKDSFSQKNIEKTVKDYRFVSDIQIENGVNKPITDTVFDPIIQFISTVFIVFIVLSFMEERKIGLWEKVHSTPGGRHQLAARRVLILLITSLVFQFILVAQRVILSSVMYGNPHVLRPIQSVPEFIRFIYPVSILEYLILYCLICGLCCFCFGLLAWLFLSIFHNSIMSIFVLSICTVIQWIIYFFNPIQSLFSIFKYANFYYFINPAKELSEYCNINIFGFIASRFWAIILSAIILSVGLSVTLIFLSNRIKPIRIPGVLDRVWAQCVSFFGKIWRRFLSKRSGFFLELYKTFGTYKGYLILLIMVIYLGASFEKFELMFSKDEMIQNNFYEEYGGPISARSLEKYRDIEKQATKLEKKIMEADEAFFNQTITEKQYMELDGEIKREKGILVLAEKLEQDYKRLKLIEDKNHIKPWFNNTMGVENMFSKQTERNRLNRVQLSVLIMILLISFSYSQETKSAMKDKLRTAARGREHLFRKKLASNLIICFLISAIVWIYDYIYYAKIFPMGDLFAPVQTLKSLGHIPFRCSVFTFLLLLFFIRWGLLSCISFFVSFLSSKFKMVATVIISFLLFLIPSLLAVIGIKLFKTVAVIDSMTLVRSIIEKGFALDSKIKVMAILLFGIAGVFLCYQQWCRKGVGYESGN